MKVNIGFNSASELPRKFKEKAEQTLFCFPCVPIPGMNLDLRDFKEQMGLNEEYFTDYGDDDTLFKIGDSVWIYPDHLLITLFEL